MVASMSSWLPGIWSVLDAKAYEEEFNLPSCSWCAMTRKQRSRRWATPEVTEAYFTNVGGAKCLSSDFVLPIDNSEGDLEDHCCDYCPETERYFVSKTNQFDPRELLAGPEQERAAAGADLPANQQGATLGQAVLNDQFEEFPAFGNFRACKALEPGEGKIRRGRAKDPKYHKKETTEESQQVNPLPSTPARATQPRSEKSDSSPETLSTSLSESEDGEHPPSDVNTSPPSVYAAELRKVSFSDIKGDLASEDGDHSPVDVPITPLSSHAVESMKIFWPVPVEKDDPYYKDLYYKTRSRLSRNLDLIATQNLLIAHSKLREDEHEQRMHIGGLGLEPRSTHRESYIQSRIYLYSDEIIATAGGNLPYLFSDWALPTTKERPLSTIAEDSEEEYIENSEHELEIENQTTLAHDVDEPISAIQRIPDVDPTALAPKGQMEVSVEPNPQDISTHLTSQKMNHPPAEIILIGGIPDPNSPKEMLVSCCKGVYDRLPSLSTCVLYCAVAIYIIVMHLTEMVKRNKANLDIVMAYLWMSPWPLLVAWITGSGQQILGMMVVFSFMLMACDTNVAVEGSGKHKMKGC